MSKHRETSFGFESTYPAPGLKAGTSRRTLIDLADRHSRELQIEIIAEYCDADLCNPSFKREVNEVVLPEDISTISLQIGCLACSEDCALAIKPPTETQAFLEGALDNILNPNM